MAALDFPTGPTNGDIYDEYVYNSAKGAWLRIKDPVPAEKFFIGETAPAGPVAGQFWLDSSDGISYVYYNDGDSSQWLQFGVGREGPLGPTGSLGPTGPTGATGSNTLLALTDTTITDPSSGDSLVYNGTNWVNRPKAGRNLVYNGAMQLAQRGTSVAGITAGNTYNTADRWEFSITTLGTWTQTLENDAPSGSGFQKSVKVLCTTADAAPAAADTLLLSQKLEGQDLQSIRKGTASAQQLTVSFWIKSNVTGTYVLRLEDLNNTRQVASQYTVTASATWEKKTITFPADTTGALNNDNGASLACQWWLGAGSDRTSGTLPTTWASTVTANVAVGQTNLAAATNNYWQITGVQLEVGPVASPFDFKPYGQELAECQRYYYLHAEGNDKGIGFGGWTDTTAFAIHVSFPVSMRIAPTMVRTSGTAYYQILNPSTNFDDFTSFLRATENGGQPFKSGLTGGTALGASRIRSNNAATKMAFDAEL